jgi:hypothetical protein
MSGFTAYNLLCELQLLLLVLCRRQLMRQFGCGGEGDRESVLAANPRASAAWCVYRKLKHGLSDDEVRPGWRVK